MKIAITASGPCLEDELDKRFGRAETILVYDTDTHFVEVINNAAAHRQAARGSRPPSAWSTGMSPRSSPARSDRMRCASLKRPVSA
jgi:hypothetical protein